MGQKTQPEENWGSVVEGEERLSVWRVKIRTKSRETKRGKGPKVEDGTC